MNTIFPIHRLRDTSHGGHRLTTPNIFAIGSWLDFRSVGWDVPSNVGGQIFNDAATLVRWDQLQGEGKVVTAFGLSDREGNDMFTCRDSSLFVDIRTRRLIEQKSASAPYSPSTFDVEMWVTNTEDRFGNNVEIELMFPIYTSPQTAGRLRIDPSTPLSVPVQLSPGQTKKIRWTLIASPGVPGANEPDSMDAVLQFNYSYPAKPGRTFREACMPTITLRNAGAITPPPPPVRRDTLPPVVKLERSGTEPATEWFFEAYDRHPGYRLDSGISRLAVVQERSVNIGIDMSGGRECDTTSTWRPHFFVIDLRRNGSIVFDVFDCAGNSTRDSVIFAPPADNRPPVMVRATAGKTPSIYWELEAFDRHAGFRFDSGIDRVEVDNSRTSNFGFTMEGGTRCDTSTTLMPRFTVIDDELPAEVHFTAFDCAGNSVRDSIIYRGDRSAVPDAATSGSVFAIESIAPNPLHGSSGVELIVRLSRPLSGRIAASVVSVDGIEIGCRSVVSIGDGRYRIELPAALAGGQYQLRVGDASRSATATLQYVP